MHYPTFLTALTLLLVSTPTTATSRFQEREALKARNWDLRLLAPNPPCNPNASNIDTSVFHRSGLYGGSCNALDPTLYNTSTVGSISWKSPGQTVYDLCVFADGDCGGDALDVVTGGWEVCYPFSGWKGWKVVLEGSEC